MTVRVILDTSALIAYTAIDERPLAVGELLATVEEDGGVTGVPALCLLAAYQEVKPSDRARLRELVERDDGPTVVLPLLASQVTPVAELSSTLREHQAHAVVAVREHGAILATRHRRTFATTLDGDDILDL